MPLSQQNGSLFEAIELEWDILHAYSYLYPESFYFAQKVRQNFVSSNYFLLPYFIVGGLEAITFYNYTRTWISGLSITFYFLLRKWPVISLLVSPFQTELSPITTHF